NRRLDKWNPINPAAPVTNILFDMYYLVWSEFQSAKVSICSELACYNNTYFSIKLTFDIVMIPNEIWLLAMKEVLIELRMKQTHILLIHNKFDRPQILSERVGMGTKIVTSYC
ncbi:MAG: hypothetical protein KAQ62_13340, partial [Cyclobacteriaceae bacterium]|nr:hypothetical protein [Cyclobacteriaceae bacterium]